MPSPTASGLTVYITRPAAPLCRRVCDYLDTRGYSYSTVEVVTEADRAEMRERTGFASCPLVLVGAEVIGKLEETIAADRAGRLTSATEQLQESRTSLGDDRGDISR